jgi:hypothetical protein
MIDIKWLLYRYHSIKQAKDTADSLFEVIRNSKPSYDPNWWIHAQGGFPNSRTESAFFRGQDDTDKAEELRGYISKLSMILTAMDAAVKSLKKELHDLIVYRYIDDDDVYTVAERMKLYTEKDELNMRKYYRLHNIALEGMNIGCMPLNFLFTKDDIEIIIGKLIVRKSVSKVSQKRVEIVV